MVNIGGQRPKRAYGCGTVLLLVIVGFCVFSSIKSSCDDAVKVNPVVSEERHFPPAPANDSEDFGNAHRVVYLCDCTGSMLSKLESLKTELGQSITNLKPIQSFNIILFQDIHVAQFEKQIVTATPETKRRAAIWIDGIISSGTTEPTIAFETALQQNPDRIYFMSDAADFADNKALLATIAAFNKDRRIRIDTILFVDDANDVAKNKEPEDLMRQIAKENSGRFKMIGSSIGP